VRRLYCRKCGYDLTPLFQGDVVEAPCPECGSPADKRRASAKLNAWWWKPAFLSICAGAVPVLSGVALASLLDWLRIRIEWPLLLPLSILAGTAVCVVVALILFPKDVPGRANFGRFWPFHFMVCLASLVVNFGLIAFVSFVMMLFSPR